MSIKRFSYLAGITFLAIAMILAGGWCLIAIWYQRGIGEPFRTILVVALTLLLCILVGGLVTKRRGVALALYCLLFISFLGWWATIVPRNDRTWAPDVARNATATIDGDRLEIINVRNFVWRTTTDFDQNWEKRTYQISQVSDVDLIMSYWMGEAIAHTIVSFGFRNGDRIAFSIEVRKENDESFSTIGGFFKLYELTIIAADERDVVRLRSNIRGEDVRVYRLRITPDHAQKLLRGYVEEANDLAYTPSFYNTLTSNCTTLAFELVRAVHPGLPLDARIILAGYLPNYAYELGATDTSMPFEELRRLSKIGDRAILADFDPGFSAKIREGLPYPH